MSEADRIRDALTCTVDWCPCHTSSNTHCPAHDDNAPSLTVHPREDGGTFVNCKSGCDQSAVLEALTALGLWGGTVRDEADEDETPIITMEKLVATYEYRLAANPTEIVAVKGRFEHPSGKKTFKWRHRDAPEGEWKGLRGKGVSMANLALWGVETLDATAYGNPVIFCEGEKATLAVREHGLTALCHAGGANTRDFGTSLDALAGRKVYLWPDNDEVGRKYMQRVMALLKGIAAKAVLLSPPARREHDDAVEFFAEGGTVDALFSNEAPERPTLRYISSDEIEVVMGTGLGMACVVTCSEMEKTARAFDTELAVALRGRSGEPYIQRVNLLSGSARESLRRELDNMFGKDHNWTMVLNTVVALARQSYLNQDRAIPFGDIPPGGGEPIFMVDDLLPWGVSTIVYGDGSAGKTYLAMSAALSAMTGRDWCGKRTRRCVAMLVDYENTPDTFKFRLQRLIAGMGIDPREAVDLPFYHWEARGIPLADQIDAIRRSVEALGVNLLIVDSAGDACGGAPEEAGNTLRYFNALAKLTGVTILTIAHIPKADPKNGVNIDSPIGSIMWKNRARRMWYVSGTLDGDVNHVMIYPKKINDGRRPRSFQVDITFTGTTGPVTFAKTDKELGDAPSVQRPTQATAPAPTPIKPSRSLTQQVSDALIAAGRALSPSQIVATIRPGTIPEDEFWKMVARVETALDKGRDKHFVAVGTAPMGRGGELVSIWTVTGGVVEQTG